jgi:hypothetical protein
MVVALFDLSTSIGWMFSTSLHPPQYDSNGSSLNIYGEEGNDAICTVKGSFLSAVSQPVNAFYGVYCVCCLQGKANNVLFSFEVVLLRNLLQHGPVDVP